MYEQLVWHVYTNCSYTFYTSYFMQMTDNPMDVINWEPKRAAPRFACFPGDERSQYFIFIERVILCVTHSFSQALMLWFVAHYIFTFGILGKCEGCRLVFSRICI